MAFDAGPFPEERAAIAPTIAYATVGGAVALSMAKSRKKHLGMSIMGIDQEGNKVIDEVAFQWWPESINDGMGVGWQTKGIPGGSHALMTWGGNEGRNLSFELKLSRSMRYLEDFKDTSLFGKGGGVPKQAALLNPDSKQNLVNNVDIRRMVRYLRAYCYPEYDAAEGGIALPPVITLLHVPGMQLSDVGDDTVFCVMTACDVTYLKAFPDGKPRLANVSLSFKPIVQSIDGVRYVSRSDVITSIGDSSDMPGATSTLKTARELNDLAAAVKG